MIPRMSAIAILVLAVCTLSLDAQGKKAPPPAGSIEIYKNKDGEYRYRIKSASGDLTTSAIPVAGTPAGWSPAP
jgi:hypothetical protein